MSMKYCPKCGKQVSSKATVCPGCGADLNLLSYCPDCHHILPEKAEICPNCGCPTEESSIKKRNKRGIIISVTVIIIIIVSVIIGSVISSREAADYEAKLEKISYTMISGAADAESAGNLIKSVWYNSIFEKSDPKTDPYTKSNHGKGAFYDDFNDALECLFSDPSFVIQINGIKSNQQEVISLMKSMKNPPSEYKDAYIELKTLYDNYLKLTDLIISPEGNLQTFSDTFSYLDTATVNSYRKVTMYIE